MNELALKVRKKLFFYYDRRKYFNIFREASAYLESKGVHLVVFLLPNKNSIKGLSKFEIERLNNWVFDYNNIDHDAEKVKLVYGQDVDLKYVSSLYEGGVVIKKGGARTLADFTSDTVNIINGTRLTTDAPKSYKRKIYTYGACTVRGIGVEDSKTIASHLQRIINENELNSFRVVNEGIGRGSSVEDDFSKMKATNYREGDIVIWCPWGKYYHGAFINLCIELNVPCFSTSNLFDRPHEYGEWFTDDTLHTTAIGNEVLAGFMFKILSQKQWLVTKGLKEDKAEIVKENKDSLLKGDKVYDDNEDLKSYIESLKKERVNVQGKVGSIVMNCNPFTFGHQYLIEYAASKVDQLYIFVVEENKSFFDFEDRMELVKKGTAHLKNVKVLPSGKFIISAITFPGYFYKDHLKDTTIDASNDLEVFGRHIAPALGINIRFAGEEPLDPVTCQYNEAMTEQLPLYGIEFEAIKRKEHGEKVISASRVRAALKDKNFEEIKELVPATTYNYLTEHFK